MRLTLKITVQIHSQCSVELQAGLRERSRKRGLKIRRKKKLMMIIIIENKPQEERQMIKDVMLTQQSYNPLFVCLFFFFIPFDCKDIFKGIMNTAKQKS